MTKDEVSVLVRKISVFYPRFEINASVVMEYARMFEKVPLEVALANLDKYVQQDESGRAPTVSKLMRMVKQGEVLKDMDYRASMKIHKFDDITYQDQNGYLWGYPEDV